MSNKFVIPPTFVRAWAVWTDLIATVRLRQAEQRAYVPPMFVNVDEVTSSTRRQLLQTWDQRES